MAVSSANGVGTVMALEDTYSFTKPSTHFLTLQAASQRQGGANTLYARIQNLSRVRVMVK